MPLGPEARYEQIESISLAFVTALQILPPRQLAVLILRDVLGFRANEVADMLDSTVGSVTSGLNRARVSLQRRQPIAEHGAPPTPGSPAEDAIVAKFVRAYESGDVDALVTLLTDDAFSSMPPIPLEYHGRDAVARLCASIFRASPGFDLGTLDGGNSGRVGPLTPLAVRLLLKPRRPAAVRWPAVGARASVGGCGHRVFELRGGRDGRGEFPTPDEQEGDGHGG